MSPPEVQPVEVRKLGPGEITKFIPELARLRIEVFRDFPYLYDGSTEYEESYLAPYAKSERAVVAAAMDGSRVIGAATGTPLADHAEDFASAFAETGYAMEDVFYFAESVLLSAYRGRGIGHRFFGIREEHARAFGFRYATFCSVIRDKVAPAGYRSLDTFWRGRGYRPVPGAVARFYWRDMGELGETEKQLQVWLREL